MSYSNRHDRRRAAKISRVEMKMVSVDELAKMPSGCAWHGCGRGTKNPDGEGWSKLLLYKGETHLNFLEIDPRQMARDTVLCPEHARYLDENLLIDVGGALRETAGVA